MKHIHGYSNYFLLTISSIIESKLLADNCRLSVIPTTGTYLSPCTVCPTSTIQHLNQSLINITTSTQSDRVGTVNV